MAKNCQACIDINDKYPTLADKGITDTLCTNLKNDEGLKASDGKNDCDDLNLMNDCLIGNLEEEIKIADACEWRVILTNTVKNLYHMIKAVICAICGLWTNVHNLWAEINRIWSAINALTARVDAMESTVADLRTRVNNLTTVVNNFADDITNLKKDDATHDCYIDFLLNGESLAVTDVTMGTGVTQQGTAITLRVKGSTYRFVGGLRFDRTNAHWGGLGLKNNGEAVSGNVLNTDDNNWTVCLIDLKKSDYPWLTTLYSTTGTFVNQGIAQLYVQVFNGDSDDPQSNSYPSQWGTGTRVRVDAGHLVVRVSMIGVTTWGGALDDHYANVTASAVGMAVVNQDHIEC